MLILKCWNRELTTNISSYLSNLEEFSLTEYLNHQNYTDPFLKFSQPTKIKRLKLAWRRVRNRSLDSILANCPQLEDLSFNQLNDYIQTDSELNINLSKPSNIKKLTILSNNIYGSDFDSLLLNCPYINELVINLPVNWKEQIKSIRENCANLQILGITSPNRLYMHTKDMVSKEFYETGLLGNNSKFKSTLTHLVLNQFNFHDSKAEYFKNFEKLKSIKYIGQPKIDYNYLNQETGIDMSLWPGYRLKTTNNYMSYDAELIKY